MEHLLSIKDLKVSIDNESNKESILNGIDLSIKAGEIHAIMGRNGSGKSTLAMTIMGHPKYIVTDGSIKFSDNNIINNIINMPPDERSKLGIFLAFQDPIEIEGVSIEDFLFQAYRSKHNQISPEEFEKILEKNLKYLGINRNFAKKDINFNFSGGEKKKAEILQLSILEPKIAILDEIDSGLDVDSLKQVCSGISKLREKNSNLSLVIITHYPRILDYLVPDFVHVMQRGKIVKSGKKELAQEIEREGYSHR